MMEPIRRISKGAAIYCLFGYFLTTTFSHALGQIFFGLALLFVIIAVVSEGGLKEKLQIDLFGFFILLFVGWSVISAVAGPTPGASLFILKEEWLFLMIPVAGFLTRDEKVIDLCLKFFVISAIVLSLYAIWQHFSGIDLYRGTELPRGPSTGYRVVGTFSHRLTFGNYYAIASVLFLGIAPYIRNKAGSILFYAGFSLSALATIFTYNRGSISVLAAGVIIFFIWVGRKHLRMTLILIAALVIIVVVAAPDVPNRYISSFKTELEGKYAGSRLSIWKTAWRMTVDNPVFGVGQGNFIENYSYYRDKDNDRVYGHAHNDILNVAAYAGVPAAFFFLGFWVVILYKILSLLRRLKEPGLEKGVVFGIFLSSVVFFLTSLYEATFADEEIRLLLMAVWGIYFGLHRFVKRKMESAENIESA